LPSKLPCAISIGLLLCPEVAGHHRDGVPRTHRHQPVPVLVGRPRRRRRRPVLATNHRVVPSIEDRRTTLAAREPDANRPLVALARPRRRTRPAVPQSRGDPSWPSPTSAGLRVGFRRARFSDLEHSEPEGVDDQACPNNRHDATEIAKWGIAPMCVLQQATPASAFPQRQHRPSHRPIPLG
jgi:hypothetical protein